jgi:anti-anti-sigma factor
MTSKPVISYESSHDEARQAWIYRVQGKLIGSQLCYELLEEARDRIDSESPHVVLEISGVTMLNSTGIGIIASLFNTTKEKGGKVYLVGATPSSQRPLAATHVWDFLERCDSLDGLPDQL